MIVKRGDVYFADLSPVVGSEQGGVRPVLVIQNDIGNRFSPTAIVAAITAQIQKAKLPTHVEIDAKRYGFERDSVILLEQIRTIDKQRLTDKITHLDDEMMDKVDEALQISLALIDFLTYLQVAQIEQLFLFSKNINDIIVK
ncbi:type II toxin-antitoxin system PemK/MazF family toxin [Bacillus subtilis]